MFASLGLLAFSSLFAVVAVLVKLNSRGPVLYRAARAGRDGKTFALLKFRTMYEDADKRGSGITSADDPRITSIGRLLRAFKLDELPQLINVLRGEISFVGPRPEDPRFVAQYPPEYRRVLLLKPGITSPASLRYRNESSMLVVENHEQEYVATIMPAKLKMDLEYFERSTFFSRFLVIVRTLLSVFHSLRMTEEKTCTES